MFITSATINLSLLTNENVGGEQARVSTARARRRPVPALGTALTRVMLAKTFARLISGEILCCRFI